MKKFVLLFALVATACAPTNPDVAAWEARAAGITIIRDDWGIPHISGETDADVAFGLIYAQAEDDFNRIEVNFLNSQGRLAESAGEGEIWRDLRMKLFIDPVTLESLYAVAPDTLSLGARDQHLSAAAGGSGPMPEDSREPAPAQARAQSKE